MMKQPLIIDDEITGQPGKKKKTRLHRRIPLFYLIYFGLILLFLIGLAFGLSLLRSVLAEYEDVQPKYTAEKVFDTYFKEPDLSRLVSMSGSTYTEFEPEEKVLAELQKEFRAGEVTYGEAPLKSGDSRVYYVYADGSRFASFTLKKGSRQTKHGFLYYDFDSLSLTIALTTAHYNVMIPQNYTLSANGVRVGDKYIAEESRPTPAYMLSDGKNGVSYRVYNIEGFLDTPIFVATSPEGIKTEMSYDVGTDAYRIPTEAVTVSVPDGCTLYLNDAAVPEKYASKELLPSGYNDRLSDDSAGLFYTLYTVDGYLSSMPSVRVTGKNGVSCTIVVQNNEGTAYIASAPFDRSLENAYGAELISVLEKYTLYLQAVKVKKADLKPYFDTDSTWWKNFNSISTIWQFEASRYEFSDEHATEFVSFGNGNFCCRVRLTYTGYLGQAVKVEKLDMMLFCRITESGSVQIYDMTVTDSLAGIIHAKNAD